MFETETLSRSSPWPAAGSLAGRARSAFEGWIAALHGVADRRRGEHALHEFAELTRGSRPVSELRQTLLEIAQRISGARRVELEIAEGLGRMSRTVLVWPPASPDVAREERAAKLGAPSYLPLRFDGRELGTLRVFLDRGRRMRPRVLHRLATLGALAAAAERSAGRPGDHEATHDPVTGAHSGPFLSAYLTHAVAQARRKGEVISIVCVGVDRLGDVIAEHGNDAGDLALRRAARAMIGTLRASDVVARLDDSRLIAVLPSAGGNDAVRVAETLRRAIAEAALAASTTIPLTASLGVASFPEHGREPGPLLAAAREALARARAQGPNRVAQAPCPANPPGLSIHRAG